MMLEYEFEVSCAESMYFYCFVCRHGRVKRTPHELGDLRVSTGVSPTALPVFVTPRRDGRTF